MSCRECGSPTSCFAGCPNEEGEPEHDEGCEEHDDCWCKRGEDDSWDTSDLGGPDEQELGGRR